MIRRPVALDADELATIVIEGFEGYRAFAPPGWEPPRADVREQLAARLGREDVWGALAERDGEIAGHAIVFAAAASRRPVPEPGLAHLWQLFVRPRWWGTGLAAELLRQAVAAARGEGFTAMRLFTPLGQARARRFYEREGWALHAELEPDDFGLPLTEYRRGLG